MHTQQDMAIGRDEIPVADAELLAQLLQSVLCRGKQGGAVAMPHGGNQRLVMCGFVGEPGQLPRAVDLHVFPCGAHQFGTGFGRLYFLLLQMPAEKLRENDDQHQQHQTDREQYLALEAKGGSGFRCAHGDGFGASAARFRSLQEQDRNRQDGGFVGNGFA